MTDQHTPLPVLGYTEQPTDKVAFVNLNKQLEERILRTYDALKDHPDTDQRWLAIARTHIEQGFMAANRAIFKPTRVSLPEDEAGTR